MANKPQRAPIYREAKPEKSLLMRRERLQRPERPLESLRVVSEVNLDLDATIACHLLEGCVDVLGESSLHDFVVRLSHDLIARLLQEANIWRGTEMCEGREITATEDVQR